MGTITHLLAVVSQPKATGLPVVENPGAAQIQTILTIVFTIVGAVALLMLTIGGLRYISAQGDPQQLAKAKGTIIYAIVGLVVSITSVSIITFVLGRI